MIVFLRWLIVAVAAVGLVAGCGGAVAGSPGPAPSPPGAQPARTLPPRPRTIDMHGVDACSLITQAQAAQLDADRVEPSQDANHLPACSFDRIHSEPFVDIRVTPTPIAGVDTYLQPGYTPTRIVITTVAGFGAVQLRVASEGDCSLLVDTAPGQHLDVLVSLFSRGALTGDQLCAKAQQAAEFAMQHLEQAG